MASQCCRFCQSDMDPHDGHRECCSAACDLSREERLHHANWVCSSVHEHSKERARSSDRPSYKSSSRHERVVEVAKHTTPAPPAEGGNTDTQLQILTAIQNLSQRMGRVEAHYSFLPSLLTGQECIPPPGQQCHPDKGTEDADVLSLLA